MDLKGISEWKTKYKKKYSFIRGLFAANNFVGLIYFNTDDKTGEKISILQKYSHDGVFFQEGRLLGAQIAYSQIPLFYCHKTGILYLVVINESDTGDVVYEVLQYNFST
jgi:hypothetical protein